MNQTGNTIETDYLVVGAGAMSLAFADVLFQEKPDARLTFVDRRAKPGGHWNDAYPFVTLHQPAAFYGVNSADLGQGGSDLATGAEIRAYYERVLQKMLRSGRVDFLPMSDYQENGQIVSTIDASRKTVVSVRQKVVDGSFMKVEVPSTHGPRYAVDDGVALIPPNELPRISKPWQRYVIVGGGKTAMDAVTFLLRAGVSTDKIQWIVPNDAWLWDRASVQPGIATAEFLGQLDAIIEHGGDVDQVFLSLEAKGSIHRIDRDTLPTKWRCATVDHSEVEMLRTINDVVRLGRVERVTADSIELQHGSVATTADTLHVDCTANGLAKLPPRPLFEKGRITLQSVFMCQQVFSAAIIGRLESLKISDEKRNEICKVIPHPEYKEDMPGCLLGSIENILNANRHMPLWLRRSRLNLMHHDSLLNYIKGATRARKQLPKALAALSNTEMAVA